MGMSTVSFGTASGDFPTVGTNTMSFGTTSGDFFLSPEHPARELLDLLLHQGSLWLLSHADDPSPIATLRTLVSTLACKLSEESNNFSTALGELRAYLAPLHQRCTETERREVQTQASMAFLDSARTLAQQQVLQALQHYTQIF